jgi:IS5 family transposase
VRPTIPQQIGLFSFPPGHQRGKVFEEINAIIAAHPKWVRWVHNDLTRKRGVKARKGRRGMSAARVLRVVLLKHLEKVSLRRLAARLDADLDLREFLGLTLGDKAPRRSTLQRNTRMIQAETWGRIFRSLLECDELREFESGEKVRVDSTVVQTNIHHPTDSSLLWDGIRVLSRAMRRAHEMFAEVEHEDLSKAAKKHHTKIFWARKAAQRAPAYERLIESAWAVSHQVDGVVETLRTVEPSSLVGYALRDELIEELLHYQPLLMRVIDQTERRVLKGEEVPAWEKVYSIFETHTDMIKKSNTRKPEFGHKVTFTMGKHFVLDAVIERGNPGDVTLATRQLDRQAELFGRAPRSAAFDGGYASRENLEAAKELGVERCAFNKAQGLTPEEMASSRRTHGRLKRFRAGIEGKISWLKRDFGLGRCTWKGWDRFQSYVWSACFAANLHKLVRLRLASKRERAKLLAAA